MSDQLLEDAKFYLREHRNENSQLQRKLFREGQDPNVFLITCADSRVLPEQMLGLKPGSYFMVRNVANIVPAYEMGEYSTAAALEYAFFVLHVRDIVICGHTDCGGLKALEQGISDARLQSVANWLEQAQHGMGNQKAGSELVRQEEAHLQKAGLHVLQQLVNLKSYPFAAEAVADGRLTLHGWIYDLREATMYYYDESSRTFERFDEQPVE